MGNTNSTHTPGKKEPGANDALGSPECPISSRSSPSSADACPVRYKNAKKYNVYSQEIDPKNQMPATANQQPAPGQEVPLETVRVKSSIPKGGSDDETWLYPSPQMFWNALVRKNKVEGASETDMDTVVAVHNNMNEGTWRQVLAWEALHPVTGPMGSEPKLLRFLGRPDEYSPKARLKMLFGHPAPFDRHDWVVDRGGREVRYVIDYYHDESAVNLDARPADMHDFHSMKSIKVDVRPALDSVEAWADRLVRMPFTRLTSQSLYNPPSFFPEKKMLRAESEKVLQLQKKWSDIQNECESCKLRLNSCDSEESCIAASMELQRCTARIVCPQLAQELDQCLQNHASNPNEEMVLTAFGNVEKCLEDFKLDSRALIEKN